MFFAVGTSTFQATGGTVIDSGGYRIHTFISNGTFQVISTTPTANTVEYLVVDGGGAGVGFAGGNGGSGIVIIRYLL